MDVAGDRSLQSGSLDRTNPIGRRIPLRWVPHVFPLWVQVGLGAAAFVLFYLFRQSLSPVLANSITFALYLIPILGVSYLVGRTAGLTTLALSLAFSWGTYTEGRIGIRDEQDYYPFLLALHALIGIIIVTIADRLRDEVMYRSRLISERARALGLLDNVIDNAPVGIAIFDREGRCIRSNAVLASLAVQPGESQAQMFADMFPLESGDTRAFDMVLRTKRPQTSLPVAYSYRQGTELHRRYFSVSLYPIVENGVIEGVAATATELTDLKMAEIERERLLRSEQELRAMAERANTSKDEFMATLSHELRTPLTTILGWTELSKMQEPTPDFIKTAMLQIATATKAQVKMIEDLLDVSRITSGRLRLERTVVDIAEVVATTVRGLEAAAAEKHILIQTNYQDHSTVFADAERLGQVFGNVLGNAIKFTPEGGTITIRVQREGSTVVTTIRDTGEGIAPEVLPHIFERFRQADMKRSRRHGGLGLGLAIVRQLVELHEGSVQAESDGVGRGTTVTIRLPRAERIIRADGTPDETPNSTEAIRGKHILVVDDDDSTRHVVRLMLEASGATVETASSGLGALDRLKSGRFDVLLSDIGMPDMDGYQLLESVKMSPDPGTRGIPAVALSAFARAEDSAATLDAGFVAHVSKPVQVEQLVSAIQQATQA